MQPEPELPLRVFTMRGKRHITLSSSALALAGLVVLGGCSGTSTEERTPAPAASSSAAAPESPSASAAELPDGAQWAESSASKVRFAVPKTWSVVDATKLFESGDEAAIASAAKDLGLTADQLRQAAGQIDVLVTGPPVKQFAPNVNVVPNALTALPDESVLGAQLESIGAKVSPGATRPTPLGEAIVVPYTLKQGTTTVHGRSIVAPVADGFTTITISHVDTQAADTIADQVLATLQAV